MMIQHPPTELVVVCQMQEAHPSSVAVVNIEDL